MPPLIHGLTEPDASEITIVATQAALAANALRAGGDTDPAHGGRIALCRFFAENIAVGAKGLEETVMSGAGFLHDATLALAS